MNTLEHSFQEVHEAPPAAPSKSMSWLRRRRWFVLTVIVPTLLAMLYYGFVAADIYTSESRFVIKNPNQKTASVSSLANLIQTTGLSAGQEQANEVLDYLRSRNALQDLEKRLDMRARFASERADFLTRYPRFLQEDRFENRYRFYQRQIEARTDAETGMVVLRVKAFTPRDAAQINTALLDLSEGMVNRLNNRAENRAIAEAERRVTAAEQRLLGARLAIRQYRNQEELIDPARQATSVLELANRLMADRASLTAQLELTERVAPANPGIPALRRRIAALDNQIAAQNRRVVGSDTGIASKLGRYEKLSVEQEFATQMLNAANASLEQARAEVLKQQFYLERVVEPNTPDLPQLPRRLRGILVVLGASLCLYFIGWMFVTGILEHSPDD